MDKKSYLGAGSLEAIEQIYKDWQQKPESVDSSWQQFFEGFEFARQNYGGQAVCSEDFEKEFRVINLINAYRQRGHLFTQTNPVRTRRKYTPTLDLENYGLSKKDLGTEFEAGKEIGIGKSSLKTIVEHLKATYCGNVGAEYMFIRQPELLEWLRTKMEKARNRREFSRYEKMHIYYHLKQAVGFEKFVHKKFMGQKRFSLEGAETLIPALDAIIERGAELGIEEFIIGMAHRGRLNVLANIMQKPYEQIFNEFMGRKYEDKIALGDVKYHLGQDSDVITDTGKQVRLRLTPNPSHLEAVGPVVQGIAKAMINHEYGHDYDKLAPILIHGDAAISAQGVVYELAQMSQLYGYRTGGTIHIVINNQVGFTTNYLDGRSSTYSTDVAKVIKSPIFHINGDDPEAMIYAIEFAMEFRQKYHRDVFIDILCYRKYGHNEGDEPRFTQPVLYENIAKHPNPRDIYGQKLVEEGIYKKEDLKEKEKIFEQLLDSKLDDARKMKEVQIRPFMDDLWSAYPYGEKKDFHEPQKTGVGIKKLETLNKQLNTLPQEGKFFKKVSKILEARRKAFADDKLDWGTAEQLALATLLDEGTPVRISGQDSERGTFAHRHAALVIEDTTYKYFPLKHVKEGQPQFHVYNSPLSEYGVLGFEYGYALAQPEGLCIWEAQFGDFYNVAQAVVDEYICSGGDKWGLKNGLVMLLPHGFEGQGPDHSSARVERWLSLAAGNNMQICMPSTPANLFHMLRNQVRRPFRVPLVAFTPKSLLRHPQCTSSREDLAKGHFQTIIDDQSISKTEDVRQIIFCSGKIYYDLIKKRGEKEIGDIAIVRIEQLYPFPFEAFTAIIEKYHNAEHHIWVQEEPENMGAWPFLQSVLHDDQLEALARPASGSPATGLHEVHEKEQGELMEKVFKKCSCDNNYKYCGLKCVDKAMRNKLELKIHDKEKKDFDKIKTKA